MTTLLSRIESPADLKQLSPDELTELAREVRATLLESVCCTGGHLASNLGTVELTLAMHYVFDSPHDSIIWDVGHQAYTHKLLTGRRDRFGTLRQLDGISGFPNPAESEHDKFMVGHSGTSISSGVGLVEGNHLAGRDDKKVVVVIGDGSMTAGMSYEGLNHAGQLDRNIIIVLNDNEMSISPNVGALSGYLSRRYLSRTGQAIRRRLKIFLKGIPIVGEDMYHTAHRMEDAVKAFLAPGFLFEALGFRYVGPLDGHNLDLLVSTFHNVNRCEEPVLVHVQTVKGKGYLPAETNPDKFHGVGAFDLASGKAKSKAGGPPSYTEVFADTMIKLGEENPKIIAITAAMPSGTGLEKFATRFPDRTYDVGISEQHGITFAAGLAKAGFQPIAAIYSTFLQRAYDQIVHDVCLQNLPVVLALDRGGLVGDDGPTHHGVFDLCYLRHIPEMIVMAASDEAELADMLASAFAYHRPVAVRYPRGAGVGAPLPASPRILEVGRGELKRPGTDAVIVAIGNRVAPALEAAAILAKEGIEAAVINARFVKPLDADLIADWAVKTGRVVTVEEGAGLGGFGSAVLEMLSARGLHNVATRLVALPDRFIEHGMPDALRRRTGIDIEGIVAAARDLTRADRP